MVSRSLYNNYCKYSLTVYINTAHHLIELTRACEQLEPKGSHSDKEIQHYESVEVDHEYEMLDKYHQSSEEVKIPQARALPPKPTEQQPTLSTGNYDITQCPAYETVAQNTQQQAETSMTVQPATDEPSATSNTQSDKQVIINGHSVEYETVPVNDN